jgi:hypothetical protein
MHLGYAGYLAPHMNQIAAWRAQGLTFKQVAAKLYDECGVSGAPPGRFRREDFINAAPALIIYAEQRVGRCQRPKVTPQLRRKMKRAEDEHAALLWCEGLSFTEIANRLGEDNFGATSRVSRGFAIIAQALRKTAITFTVDDGWKCPLC